MKIYDVPRGFIDFDYKHSKQSSKSINKCTKYEILKILVRIKSNVKLKRRRNTFHDSYDYNRWRTVCDIKFKEIMGKLIEEYATPPNLVKFVVDNIEVPEIVIKDSFRWVSIHGLAEYYKNGTRFKLIL